MRRRLDKMELNPEEKVEIKIGVWLMQNKCQVYFNRQSKKFDVIIPNYKIFKIKGTRKKPDMVFKNQCNGEYIALELKDSNKNINLRKGTKIIDYYNDYINLNAKYIIENKEIKINHFLIGTLFSSEGHLFKDEFGFKNNLASENKGKVYAAKHNLIPYFEYNRTHEFIRQLWQTWVQNGKDSCAGVGILLSDSLNELNEIEKKEGKPAILSQEYRKRWNQYWYKLR